MPSRLVAYLCRMKKCLLYYPGSLPTLSWLTGAVLYADGLLSIFPTEEYYQYLVYDHRNAGTDTFSEDFTLRQRAIRYLTDESLFEAVLATDFIDDALVDGSRQELQQMLTGNDRLADRVLLNAYDHLTNDRLVYNVIESDTHSMLLRFITDTYHAYADAPAEWMFDGRLIDEGIWLLLRLVRESFSQKGRQVIPSTDNYDYTNLIFQHSHNEVPSVRLVINRCLPIPEPETPIETVVAFRRQHTDLLTQFNRLVHEFQIRLLQVVNDEDLSALLYELEQSVSAFSDRLSDLFRSEKILVKRANWSSLLYLNTLSYNKVLTGPSLAQDTGIADFARAKKRAVRLINTNVTTFIRQANRIGGIELSQLLEV